MICTKHKAITAFFPYAAQQEWDGKNEAFDVLLHTIRASKQQGFMWHRVGLPITMLLNKENPVSLRQAVILVLPHLPWWNPTINAQFVQLWAGAACAVPCTLDVGQAVVDTLLLIASQDSLQSHIPTDMWSWLNKYPSLPPTCIGSSQGTKQTVVQAVRKLGNIEILTSYLLLVWSEWGYLSPDGLEEMRVSIREDFCGVGMGYQRKNLLQHLGHILDQLDLGLEHIQQHNQDLCEDDIQSMKGQYGQLKEALLEVDKDVTDVLVRESPRLAVIIGLLTQLGICRVPLKIYVQNPSPMLVIACLEHLPLPPNVLLVSQLQHSSEVLYAIYYYLSPMYPLYHHYGAVIFLALFYLAR